MMKTNPYPYFIFEMFCKAAGDYRVAQMPDVTGWGRVRCHLVMIWADVRMTVLAPLWYWR